MAFEVAQDREVPENTTNSSYTLNRLGNPVLRAGFIETVLDRAVLKVLSVRASIEGGAIDTLRFVAQTEMGMATTLGPLVGARVQQGSTDLGTITAVPQEDELTLSAPLPEGISGTNVFLVRRNVFANELQRPSKSGRSYERILDSSDSLQQAFMERMMGTMFITAGMALVQALGLASTITVGDVQQAVIALATTGDGLTMEDIIASQMEELEKAIRRGDLTCGTLGDAPLA